MFEIKFSQLAPSDTMTRHARSLSRLILSSWHVENMFSLLFSPKPLPLHMTRVTWCGSGPCEHANPLASSMSRARHHQYCRFAMALDILSTVSLRYAGRASPSLSHVTCRFERIYLVAKRVLIYFNLFGDVVACLFFPYFSKRLAIYLLFQISYLFSQAENTYLYGSKNGFFGSTYRTF